MNFCFFYDIDAGSFFSVYQSDEAEKVSSNHLFMLLTVNLFENQITLPRNEVHNQVGAECMNITLSAITNHRADFPQNKERNP